ncbi:MAG: hypothetical protein ABJF23_17625 [Bryobacteraceae bacterium]
MIVRNRQFAGMQSFRDREFARNIIGKLKAEYPSREELADEENLHPRVLGLITQARGHGFTTDRELRAFIALDLLVAEKWVEFPRISEILNNSSLDEASRLEYVLFNLEEEEWVAIRQWSRTRVLADGS